MASVLAFTAWQEKGGQDIDVYMDSCGGKKRKQKKQVILSTSKHTHLFIAYLVSIRYTLF